MNEEPRHIDAWFEGDRSPEAHAAFARLQSYILAVAQKLVERSDPDVVAHETMRALARRGGLAASGFDPSRPLTTWLARMTAVEVRAQEARHRRGASPRGR